MSWIKENKFLSGFLGVMLLGVGALGFLLFTAKGAYDAAQSQYEIDSAELNRLLALAPYPDEENLKKLDLQKKEHVGEITKLQQALAAAEIPLEQQLSPVEFQDRLKEAVSRVDNKKDENRVDLPKEFFLGFEAYRGEPPRPEAAPHLGRQLKAMEWLVSMILENKGSISKLERSPLPSENDPSEKAAEKGGDRDKSSKSLLEKYPIEVAFKADQKSVRAILNEIVKSKTQFFIPRHILVKNEKEKAPPKVDPLAGMGGGVDPGVATAQNPPGTPSGVKTPPKVVLVFGSEKNDVTLRLEMIDFASTASPASAK